MVLGRVSTSVIASGIANGKVFADQPFAYSYGMMWTLMLGGIWQGWASKNGFNVSATHSIIGGIVGFALAFNGADGVIWLVDAPKSIPPVAGIVPIVVAWFFAPIATGVCSSSVFLITRSLVLRSEHSYERSFFVLPLYVVITLWINIYFVFTKGAKKTLAQGDWSDDKAAWVAICIAAGLGLMSFALLPLVRRRAEFLDNEENERNSARESRYIYVYIYIYICIYIHTHIFKYVCI
jgi:sodium-dependent phosphate transporter